MRYPQDVPLLTDGTVTLRAHREQDVSGVYEQSLDPVSQAWTTVPVPYTIDRAKRFVREVMPGGWQIDQEWGFAVEFDGEYGATISLRNLGDGRAEVAYGSHPRIRGTGGMERALRLLLDWGFDQQDLQMVVWWANRGNWTSRRLAWRLGFAIDATLRSWLPQRGELLDAWGGTLLVGEPRLPRHPWLRPVIIDSESAPVRLRALRLDDVPRIVEGCTDPTTASWLGELPRPYLAGHAEEYLLRCGEQMAAGAALPFAVADATDDRLLGAIALSGVDRALGSAQLGFWTHPAERGRGVTTQAARLALRHAFLPEDVGGLGLARVVARAAVGNDASRGVLRAAGLHPIAVERLATRTATGPADAVLHEAVATDA